VFLNHLIGTLKPNINGPLYSNTVSGTPLSPVLAVPNVSAHPQTVSVLIHIIRSGPLNG